MPPSKRASLPRRLLLRLSMVAAALLSCGGSRTSGHGSAAPSVGEGIEERALRDRLPLVLIERRGDPQAAIGFSSLARDSPERHAEFGRVLAGRLERAGFGAELTAHGFGFELALLVESPARASAAVAALISALTTPIRANEAKPKARPRSNSIAALSHVARCSGELPSALADDVTPKELEQLRVAAFAADSSAISVVGPPQIGRAVAQALSRGTPWPERGHVASSWPERETVQVLRGHETSAELSLALYVPDPNRALAAASALDDAESSLALRLSALAGGFRLQRVLATAQPRGACLRLDVRLDASPPPDVQRLGFAARLMEEEARLALAERVFPRELERRAMSALDPRHAARRAAYFALVEPGEARALARLVALVTPDGTPTATDLDRAIRAAERVRPSLTVTQRVELGQPGFWALVAVPCASAYERREQAGHAAVLFTAASMSAPRSVTLEPWVGAGGAGLVGYVTPRPNEAPGAAARRLADALGRALVAAPTALDIAASRGELLRSVGATPRPMLGALLDALAPSHVGALAPRGTFASLEAASRDAILARQRELLRLPHRLAILSPTSKADATALATRLGRYLELGEPVRSAPCPHPVEPPARGQLVLSGGDSSLEGSYIAFRLPPDLGSEATALVELLNRSGGLLERAMSDPDMLGAARAALLGGNSALALVVQVSAFESREAEALERVHKLFERLSSGTLLSAGELEGPLRRLREAHRLAELDPRYRLVELFEDHKPALVSGAALRRLITSLRPDAAIVAAASKLVTPASQQPAR